MKEIFAEEKNEEYMALKKGSIDRNFSSEDKSFIHKLKKIDAILNSNVDFVNKVIKIRYNMKTLRQYDEEYVNFIRLYSKIVNEFATKITTIINKNISKPSFILDLSIYRDDISMKIIEEIVKQKKNLQLLGMKLNIYFKDKKRYADELYAMYYNYENSINMIRDELVFDIYSKRL